MILKSTASPLVIQATPHFGTLSSFVTNTFHPLSHTIYTAFKMVGFNCKSNPVVNPSIQDFPGGPVVRTRHANCWGAWVQSLLGELKSHRSHSAAKKKKKSKFLKSAFKILSHWLCGQFNSPIISIQSHPIIQVVKMSFHSSKEARNQ